jgi:hypothetical protein
VRIVVDTNVFVSAVFFGGLPARILESRPSQPTGPLDQPWLGVSPLLDYADQIISADLTVSQYLRQKARTDGLAGVDRNNRCPAIGVAEEPVTSALSDDLKTERGQGSNDLLAGDTRQSCHSGESQALDSYEFEALDVFTACL